MDLYKLLGVVAYLGVLVGIGVVASRRMKDMRDYFAAGKQLGFWAVAFSARATGESAWLLLGLTGMGALVGVHAFWVVAGEVIGVSLSWLAMSRRFKNLTDRYDAITIPDYLEGRFAHQGRYLRLFSAAALVVFVTIYVSAQIDATGAAFESFLGWNYYTGALVGFVVVLVYIVTGGFVAVAWSDVFQGTLMFVGLVALPTVGLVVAGGLSPVLDGLATQDPGLLDFFKGEKGFWVGIFQIVGFLGIGIGFLGSPQIFVRFLALRSPKEINKGAAVAIIWTLLADSGAVVTGLVGRHLLSSPGGDVEKILGNGAQDVLPLLVEHLLPGLLVGLFIAVVLSAIMSTVDSLLVLASSAAVRDVYQQVMHPEMPDDQLVRKSRGATFLLAFISLGVAFLVAVLVPGRTVFWFVIFGWSGIAATFCPTTILSLFWSGFTGRGALAAMVCGFFAVPFFKFAAVHLPGVGPLFEAVGELPPAFAASFVAGVVLSLLDPKRQEQQKAVSAELREAAK